MFLYVASIFLFGCFDSGTLVLVTQLLFKLVLSDYGSFRPTVSSFPLYTSIHSWWVKYLNLHISNHGTRATTILMWVDYFFLWSKSHVFKWKPFNWLESPYTGSNDKRMKQQRRLQYLNQGNQLYSLMFSQKSIRKGEQDSWKHMQVPRVFIEEFQ